MAFRDKKSYFLRATVILLTVLISTPVNAAFPLGIPLRGSGSTTPIKCINGYTDSNGTTVNGSCVLQPTDGMTKVTCDSGYADSNGTVSGGTCVPTATGGTVTNITVNGVA